MNKSPAGSGLHVELTLSENRARPRLGMCAQASVPLAQGMLGDGDIAGLALRDGGTPLPLQTRALAHWSDGSVKWLLLDFLVVLRAKEIIKLQLSQTAATSATTTAPRIVITEDAHAVAVNTGPLSLRLFRDRPGILGDIRCDNASVPMQGLRLVIVDIQGREYVASGEGLEVQIEERGPIRSVVHIRGRHMDSSGQRCTTFELRLTFFAGSSAVQVRHAFINPEPPMTTELKRVAIEVLSEGDVIYAGSRVEPGWQLAAESDYRLSIRETKEAAPKKLMPRAEPGPIAIGQEKAEVSGGGICLALAHFKEQYPKAYRPLKGGLAVELWPEGETLRYHRGMGKAHTLMLGFYGGSISREQAQAVIAAQSETPHACPDANYHASTRAIRGVFAAGREWGAYSRLEMSIKDVFNYRDVYFGMLNFGDDIGWGYTQAGRGGFEESGPHAGKLRPLWNNFEYDFPFVAFHQYLRTGEDYYFEEGQIAVQHMLGVDFLHPHEGAALEGGSRLPQTMNGVALHTVEHTRNGGWSACHMWVGGIVNYYLLTGDQDAWTKANAIGRSLCWWAHSEFGERVMQPGRLSREYGWPLIALSELYDVNPLPEYLAAMQRIVGYIDVWQRKSPVLCDCGFAVMMCLTGLARFHGITKDPAVPELFLRLMKAARELLYLPEGLLAISRTETRPGSYGKRWGHGIMGCEALAYAYELTGDREFIRTGVREIAYLIDSNQFRFFVSPARLFCGWMHDYAGHTSRRSDVTPVSGREIAQYLRHTYRFFEVAHELELLDL